MFEMFFPDEYLASTYVIPFEKLYEEGYRGVIFDIDFKDQSMDIVFEDRSVKYDFSFLEELEHAYAITGHKSQGSEYPIVIIPAYRAPEMLLTRNRLYTAVTRAQSMVIIVGDRDIVKTMVENNRQMLRYTGLANLFGEKA